MAALEAASVPAFERLSAELALHGAPSALVARALEARDDERRHAALVVALARRYGAERGAVRRSALPLRSLRAVAEENGVEGCVHETFAALLERSDVAPPAATGLPPPAQAPFAALSASLFPVDGPFEAA